MKITGQRGVNKTPIYNIKNVYKNTRSYVRTEPTK